jgi:hypothetical protein
MISICDTLNCNTIFPTIPTPDCGFKDFGRQIVRVILGDVDANPFASTTDLSTLSSWQARFGNAGTGSTATRLVTFTIHEGIKPAGDVETQKSPTGANEEVERTQMVSGMVKYILESTITAINQARCRRFNTMWFVTDKDYVFGGVTGFQYVTTNWGNYSVVGKGNGMNSIPFNAEWFAKDDTIPYLVAGLSKEDNP